MQDNATLETIFPLITTLPKKLRQEAARRRSELTKKGLDEQTIGRNQRSNNHYLQRRRQRIHRRC